MVSFDVILANMMRSALQELDSNLISKENLIHEQSGKLAEKDRIIQNNKAEMERLEKKIKTQEHKVRHRHTPYVQQTACLSICFSLSLMTLWGSVSD